MPAMFSKPPSPPDPALEKMVADRKAAEAARAMTDRLRKSRGYKSTIATGPGGFTGNTPSLKPTLGE